MSVHQKIDHLLASLHVLAGAPDAPDAPTYQETIRTVLSDLPEQSRPAGSDQQPDTDPHRLRTSDAEEAGMSQTDGLSYTPWPFEPLADGEGITGGSRGCTDSPTFSDHTPRKLTACPAMGCSMVPGVCVIRFFSAGTILEGGILCGVEFTELAFPLMGTLQWHDRTGAL